MPFPVLQDYLDRLCDTPQSGTRVWRDTQGRAQGRYFNSTLTSAFQPIRVLDTDRIIGFEGFARSYSETDHGLSLWRLLDHAANDNESIELDRLCRMLHAINFYRQADAKDGDLFLGVHARLLAAVDGNHGAAFRRVLSALDLPHEKIVLQLPMVVKNQEWLLQHVSDNYRRNGFRLALNVANIQQASDLLALTRPEAIKVDAREIVDEDAALHLLKLARQRGVRIIFKRVENTKTLESLRHIGNHSAQPIYVQGFLWDIPKAAFLAEDGFKPVTDVARTVTPVSLAHGNSV